MVAQHPPIKARTPNVPHVQLEPVVHQALDVKALRRHDVRNVLIAQLLQNRRLARVVQTQHQQPGLLVGLMVTQKGQRRRVDEKRMVGTEC